MPLCVLTRGWLPPARFVKSSTISQCWYSLVSAVWTQKGINLGALAKVFLLDLELDMHPNAKVKHVGFWSSLLLPNGDDGVVVSEV
jgi:hypothetical protein